MKTLKEYIDKLTEIESEAVNEASYEELDSVPNEVREVLDELEEHLNNAIESARYLSRIGRNVRGPFTGQLESYLIPHLRSWVNDEHQPGSIPSLRGMVDERDEDSDY